MARAITVKQGWALAFGRYLRGCQQRGESLAPPKTEYQQRLDAAEKKGKTICWKCDRERLDTNEECKHCGADRPPF